MVFEATLKCDIVLSESEIKSRFEQRILTFQTIRYTTFNQIGTEFFALGTDTKEHFHDLISKVLGIVKSS